MPSSASSQTYTQPLLHSSDEEWTLIIRPHNSLFNLNLREVWCYRDLLFMFVRRDFVAVYKQTILGPLWFFIQPLLTVIIFNITFNKIAKIPTDGFPAILFYLAGLTPWNYFSSCLTKTSNTFVENSSIFGKVYFPRLIVPLSVVVSTMIQFSIQFVLFIILFIYFFFSGSNVSPQWGWIILLTPALVLLMAALGLGSGIVVSSLTTKYRDFTFLLGFGVQLLFYTTPVIYPMSSIPTKWQWLILLNPMTAPVEAFRAIFLGGSIPWFALGISTLLTVALVFFGIVIFNKVEKSFMDTV
jgi:lipopolysaccharide transport system permease protein